jgi:hypothetical protein
MSLLVAPPQSRKMLPPVSTNSTRTQPVHAQGDIFYGKVTGAAGTQPHRRVPGLVKFLVEAPLVLFAQT